MNKVIAGKFKGRKLISLKDCAFKSSSQRMKEGLFSIVQFKLAGCSFLDLFAGSGQIGIEAISRNANSVTFVDQANSSIAILKQNLNLIGINENFKIKKMNAIKFLNETNEMFDLIFLDPPFKKTNLLLEALHNSQQHLKKKRLDNL